MGYANSKRLGQVFLVNLRIQKKISDYILGLNNKHLLEVGPGRGAITRHIYSSFPFPKDNFRTIEIDYRFAGYLRNKFPELTVVNSDFLVADIKLEPDTLLFGNLPYNIVPQILIKFINTPNYSQGVFMVQKECFETMSAGLRTKEYSSFSVLIQTFLEIKRVINVSRDNFNPVPKVDSVVCHLVKNRKIHLDPDSFKRYSGFLRSCFSMPRKTLRNNLRKFYSEDKVFKLFELYGFTEKTRPDELSADTYLSIFLEGWFFSSNEKAS